MVYIVSRLLLIDDPLPGSVLVCVFCILFSAGHCPVRLNATSTRSAPALTLEHEVRSAFFRSLKHPTTKTPGAIFD